MAYFVLNIYTLIQVYGAEVLNSPPLATDGS